MSDKNSSKVRRRSVLKSAGAVAGLGLAGGVVEASSHGSVKFSELRIGHDVTVPSSDEYYYPFSHFDEFGRAYVVNQDQSTLYVNEEYALKDLQVVKNNDSVLANPSFSSLPSKRGQCQTSGLATKVLDDYRVTERLSIEEGYDEPEIAVTEQNEKITVDVNGKRTSVRAGSEERVTLSPQQVRVEAYKTVKKNPEEITIAGGEEWQEPWRKPKQREYQTKTVTVTPKVHIRNHGELEAVGVDSKAPKYNPRN